MGVKAREKVKGSGDWYVRIDYRGVRKSVRVGVGKAAHKRAEALAEQIRARLTLGNYADLERRPTIATSRRATAADAPAFEQFATDWLDWYPAMHAVRPSTLENYRSFVKTHLIPFFGAAPVSEITPERIEAFIEAKRAPGGSVRFQGKALADGSLRTGLLALRLILKRAVRRKHLAGNPMADVEWRGMPRVEHVDPFTGAELRAIRTAAEQRDADLTTMFRVWMQTGMRAGEVCGLQWQDFDLERGAVMVQRTWTRQRLGPTKTGRARLVSLLHPVADDTPEWRPGSTEATRAVLAGLRRVKVQGLAPEAFVFGGRGGQPLSSMELHRRWRRVLLAARVRYRVPEQLRHTFASTMLSRNAPLLYVQQQGGWRSASVLLRVYAAWLPQADLAATPQPSATQAQPGVATRA